MDRVPARIAALIAMAIALAACQTTPTRAPASGVQLQSYQAKEFETDKRVAFAAAMSVFQDLGFIIDDGDFDTGLITASGPTDCTNSHEPCFDDMITGRQPPANGGAHSAERWRRSRHAHASA